MSDDLAANKHTQLCDYITQMFELSWPTAGLGSGSILSGGFGGFASSGFAAGKAGAPSGAGWMANSATGVPGAGAT